MTTEKRFPDWATDERYRFVRELTYGEFFEELRHRSALFGTVREIILITSLRRITGAHTARLGMSIIGHDVDMATSQTHSEYLDDKARRKNTPGATVEVGKRSGVFAITNIANSGILMFLDLFLAKRCGLIAATDELIADRVSESIGANKGFKELKRLGKSAINREYLDSLRNNLLEKGVFYSTAKFKWPQRLE